MLQVEETGPVAASRPPAGTDRTVLASVVSEDFVAGFVVMERSLRETNPGWRQPIVAIDSDASPLSPTAKAVIREHCHNVHFARANARALAPVHAYARDVIGTPPRLWPAFAVLETTRWSAFDRVIAIDSDVVVRGSLEPLLHAPGSFSAVRARRPETDEQSGYFNTGVMVLNRPMLVGFDMHRLHEYLGRRQPAPGTGKADQAVLNMLWHNEVMGYLPDRFNFTKRSLMFRLRAGAPQVLDDPEAIDAWLTENGIAIFHYVGEKPWNHKVRSTELAYAAMDELWHELLGRYAQRSLLRLVNEQRRAWQDRYNAIVRRAQQKNLQGLRLEREIAREMGL